LICFLLLLVTKRHNFKGYKNSFEKLNFYECQYINDVNKEDIHVFGFCLMFLVVCHGYFIGEKDEANERNIKNNDLVTTVF
jgi:hypothetical protein